MKKKFNLTPKDLINFESEIADLFNNAKIRAPIHLYHGNENEIIKIFKKINIKKDWVFCSWRSHYQCLLKGVPKSLLKKKIVQGESISLVFPKYKIYSSAIVGGSLPIAVGVAESVKLNNSNEKVFCFLGDMTSETGIAHECFKYSINHKLPIHFIIEDNNLSVMTKTKEVWKSSHLSFTLFKNKKYFSYYKYKSKYPHAGAGVRVQF